MNKKLTIVLIIVAFLVGVVGGGWTVSYFSARSMERFYSITLVAQTGMDVSRLNRLRANNVSKAIEILEIELDGSLVGLGVYLHHIPESLRDPTAIKILQMAKKFRSKFPHKSDDPLSNQMVSNAFSLVEFETNK